MLLAQGRYFRAWLAKPSASVELGVLRDSLPEDLKDLRELRIDVPLDHWNRVVKHVRSDRKLLGGLLLDFAKSKDQVATLVSHDRLFSELQRVVLDATTTLVENETLSLRTVEAGSD